MQSASDAIDQQALETAIEDCVRRFYAKGAEDPLLGPVFEAAIPDLEGHLKIVVNFWSKSLLGTERYEGQPFAAHINLPLEPEHFTRWLELFTASAQETLPQAQADQAVAKASHMTQCFQSGLFPFTGADGRPSKLPPH
jgi:hemoglobin